MVSRRTLNSGASLSLKTSNKLRRKQLYVEDKKAAGKARHEERHRRRKEEAKNPELRKERLANNQTLTLEKKRIWDDVDDDSLGAVVDVAALKRRRLEAAAAAEAAAGEEADNAGEEDEEEDEDDDADSMLDSDEDDYGHSEEKKEKAQSRRAQRIPSIAPSTASTNLDLTPDSLSQDFKHLFVDELPPLPKILVTTSLNATIHKEAQDIAALFPNSTYIRRTAHRHGHKYSVREIAKFAKSEHSHVFAGELTTDSFRRPWLHRPHCCYGGPEEALLPRHHASQLGGRPSRSDSHILHPWIRSWEGPHRPWQCHKPLRMARPAPQ
jgi:ribosome production factor 1